MLKITGTWKHGQTPWICSVAGTKIEASGKNVKMGLSRIPPDMGRFIVLKFFRKQVLVEFYVEFYRDYLLKSKTKIKNTGIFSWLRCDARLYCAPGKVQMNSRSQWEYHEGGVKHKRAVTVSTSEVDISAASINEIV